MGAAVNVRPWLIALCTLVSACDTGGGARLPHDGDSVVGEVRKIRLSEAARAIDVARRHAVALGELIHANPNVPGVRDGRIAAGAELTVPTRFVLPDAPRSGIVVNRAEMRLYYYVDASWRARSVLTFPAAVGREDWETPTGRTTIAERIRNPKWYPPESIRKEAERNGEPLPDVVPPGPQNPLGEYALRLGWNKHMIHGTNNPRSIGTPITHGCIRLYPEDMETLFEHADVGTQVTLVDQPYKLGVSGGALYLESHAVASARDPLRRRIQHRIDQWEREQPGRKIDRATVRRALDEATEVPVKISL